MPPRRPPRTGSRGSGNQLNALGGQTSRGSLSRGDGDSFKSMGGHQMKSAVPRGKRGRRTKRNMSAAGPRGGSSSIPPPVSPADQSQQSLMAQEGPHQGNRPRSVAPVSRPTGQSRTVTSVRSVAHQLGVELGALIDSCQIFDMRDAYVRGELQSNRVVWKVYYKGRLSDMKMNEIRLFHHERLGSGRPSSCPLIVEVRETEDLYIVYLSHFEYSLYQEWLRHKNTAAQSNTKQLEKKLATWVVQILVILSNYWYEAHFFEFISPYHTFYVNQHKKVIAADFYGCAYASQADGSIAKPRNENFSPILMPPEFAKGKLKLENAGFDDIDAFIPSMIWLAAAQVYFFVFGTTPAYKQVGETFTLQLPPEVNKYSRHFKRFLLLSLDHEMENRFADFDQCRESKWVDSQFGCVVVDTPQQIRDKYKKQMTELFEKGPKSDNNTIIMPRTRILYCRKSDNNFDKSEFDDKNFEFRDLSQMSSLLKFEQKILGGEYKGLIPDPKEAFLDPHNMNHFLPDISTSFSKSQGQITYYTDTKATSGTRKAETKTGTLPVSNTGFTYKRTDSLSSNTR